VDVLLSLFAVVAAFVGAMIYMLVAFVPRLGVRPLLWLGQWKIALAMVSFALAGIGYQLRPGRGRLAAWIATAILGVLSYVLFPPRIFKTLRFPRHLNAKAADLGDNAAVLGFENGGEACAWPMEMVVPRHLIQDRVGNNPLLVAY
jgi:hypothetical protein